MIPYGRQDITAEDIAEVTAVLKSDLITQGPSVGRFEQSIARYCGARHGVAVNSGTSALHIACQALGLGPGDRLWTSPYSFVASANCGRYCGADVDFVDIDPRSGNMDVNALASKLQRAAAAGKLPKVVVPVHFAGLSCDMSAFGELARQYGFQLLEDAAHALGGRYRGRPVGSCRHSAICIFSFHPVKLITTGEGGVAVTNDEWLADRMARLRSHGITREPAAMSQPPDGPWYYQQLELGHNYRMTDFQAALGSCQLRRLDENVARRRELALRYNRLLSDLPLLLPESADFEESAMHLYTVQLDPSRTRVTREALFEQLRSAGIGVSVHYIPIHTQPYYRRLGFSPGDFPHAEQRYARTLSLPLFPNLDRAQQDSVIDALKRGLKSA